MKFTFKNSEKPTGLAMVTYKKTIDIKLNGMSIGQITNDYKIRLRVTKDDINEDGNPNCSWRWITLKKENASFDDAKTWLNINREALLSKYKIAI